MITLELIRVVVIAIKKSANDKDETGGSVG